MILSDHRLPSRPIFFPDYLLVWHILRGDHTKRLLFVDLNGRPKTPMILSDHRLPSRPIFFPDYLLVWHILRGDHTKRLLFVDLNGRPKTPMILSDHRLPSRPFFFQTIFWSGISSEATTHRSRWQSLSEMLANGRQNSIK